MIGVERALTISIAQTNPKMIPIHASIFPFNFLFFLIWINPRIPNIIAKRLIKRGIIASDPPLKIYIVRIIIIDKMKESIAIQEYLSFAIIKIKQLSL